MSIADLQAMADKLKEAKQEVTEQLRAIEADLCGVLLAIDAAKVAPTMRKQ
jgi:hypothetical protein